MCSFISLNVIVHCAPMCKNRRGIPHDVDSQKGSNFLELLKSVEKLLPLENTYTELCWATPVQGLGDFYKKYGDFWGWGLGLFSLYPQKSPYFITPYNLHNYCLGLKFSKTLFRDNG